jgi:hypothetical protein
MITRDAAEADRGFDGAFATDALPMPSWVARR